MKANQKLETFRRRTIENYIEQLIALLDTLDGDADLEETGDDEPSIGNQGLHLDGALFYDLERDDADHEPRLGWSNPTFGKRSRHDGGRSFDVEDDECPMHFTGDGHHAARKQLREKINDPRILAIALDRTRVSPGYGTGL